MAEPANRRWVYPHTLAARLSHWITVLALAILVPSGFQIFNAHPALERQLGYKMAKYVMTAELVESFARIEGGRGGYWEDRGYEWYAGI